MTDKAYCPNCSAVLNWDDLIVTEDFHICPKCKLEGWSSDFEIHAHELEDEG